MKILLCALMVVASSVAFCDDHFPDISQKDLLAAIASNSAVIVDVNGTDSYKSGHIPTAIDYATQKDSLEAVLPKDKSALVVAYCGSPQCGAWKSAATAIAALGYTNVHHFVGGISGWKDSGAAVEK
jgi:rhodanese-related sulfurtransferase